MRIFRQLGQLLWKNFALRRRQPHVLLLELLWPIIIFAVISVVRQGMNPSKRETCSYNHHAMPSAGMVPFLQSTVCNIENPCGSKIHIQQTQQSAQKLTSLVNSLQPYLTDTDTRDALDSIDTGVQLIQALGTINEDGAITNVLDNSTFVVRKFLKNPEEIRKLIVDDLKVMTGDTADALLNATINVGALVSNLGYIDFRRIVCDVDRLKEYMLFRKGVNVGVISQELCSINDSQIPTITDAIQKQLDIAAIIRSAKSLTQLTGKYEMTDALEDIASLFDLLFESSSFKSILKEFPVMLEIPELLRQMPSWFERIQSLQLIDTNGLDTIVKAIDPLIEEISPGNEIWNITKSMIHQFGEITQAVGDGKNIDWEKMLQNGQSLSNVLLASNESAALLTYVNTFTNPVFTNITSILMSGNQTISAQMFVDALNSLQPSIEQMLGKSTAYGLMYFMEGIADSIIVALHALTNIDVIDELIQQDTKILDAVDILIRSGPNMTDALLNQFLTPETIQELFSNFSTTNMKMTCKKMIATAIDGTDVKTITELQNALCTDDVASIVQTVINGFNTSMFEAEMQKAILKINNAFNMTDNSPIYLSNMAYKIGNISEMVLELFMGSNSLWNKIQTGLSNPLTSYKWPNINPTDWNKLYEKASTKLLMSSWPLMITTVGPMVEQTPIWSQIAPWMWTMDTMMQYYIDQMDIMKDMTDVNTTIGMIMKYSVDYAPEFVEGTVKMIMTPNSQFLQDIMTNPAPDVLFCDKHILQQIVTVDYVPVTDMETRLCKTNWTTFAKEMEPMYNIEPMMQQITKYYEPGNTVVANTKFNWTKMFHNTEVFTKMFENPMNMLTMGPTYVFENLNITAVMTAMIRGMTSTLPTPAPANNNPEEMDYSVINMIIQGIEEVEPMFINSSEWRVMQHYVKLWDDLVIVMNKYLNLTEDGNTLNLDQYLSNMSPSFEKFVSESANLTPELIEALKNITVSPDKVIQKLFSLDFSKVCHGVYLSSVFDNPRLRSYEESLCKLNWTKIMSEMAQSDPNIAAFTEELNLILTHWHDLPVLDLDWRMVVNNTVKFMELLEKGSLPNLQSNIFNMDLNRLNVTWQSYVQYLSSISTLDEQKLADLLNEMQALIYKLPKMQNNMSEEVTMVMRFEQLINFQVFEVMKFMNKQLKYFNDSKVVDIKRYMNSSELNKVLDVIENGQDINLFLTSAMINIMSKPQEIMKFITSLTSLCNDTSVLKSLVPGNVSVDVSLVQSSICGLDLNITLLLEQLTHSIDGLQELMHVWSFSVDSNFTIITYSQLMAAQAETTLLISDLIKHPRNFTLSSNDDWMNFKHYQKQWDIIMHKLQAQFAMENLTQLSSQSLNDLLPLLFLNNETRRDYEITYLLLSNMLNALDQMNATLFNVESLMGNSPHLIEMWQLLQKPGVVEVLLTSINTPQMSELFAMSAPDALQQLCYPGNNNFTHYFTAPSYVTVDMSQIQTDFCNNNISVIMKEVMALFHINEIGLKMEDNYQREFNITNIQAQYSRVVEKILHWIEHPPTVTGISLIWMNESYWTQLLTDYAMSVQTPQNITQQITSFLESVGPLLLEEPFKSYVLFLEAFQQLLMDNTKFDLNGLTLENLVDRIPIMQDLFRSLNMSPDVIKLLMAAPFKHPNAMIDLAKSPDMGKELCSSSSHFWQSILDWGSLPSATPVTFDYCNQTESEFFQKLVKDLKLTDIIAAMTQMSNDSATPDWKKVIQGSMELTNHIQNMVNATSSGIDISKTLDYLNSLYQVDILSTTNFTQLYAQIHAIMGNTPEWQMIDSFFKSGQVLTDFLNNLFERVGVKSGKIDLGVLFKNSTRIHAMMSAVQLDENVISAFMTGYLKMDKYTDFIMMLSNDNKTEAFLCDETQWPQYFSFPSSVNLTMIVTAVCGVNGEELQKELMQSLNLERVVLLFTNSTALPEFNVQSFITSVQHMSENIMALMNVSSVDFTGLDISKLSQLNESLINARLQEEIMKLSQMYASLAPGIGESMMAMLFNGTEFRTTAAMVAGFTMWTKLLNGKLKKMSEQPLNMSYLFGGSAMDPAIKLLLTDPRWIEEIAKMQVNPEKLLALLSNGTGSDICRAVMESVVDPKNATVIPKLEDIICSINQSTLALESMTMFLSDLQFAKQFQAVVDEAMHHATMMNISALNSEVTELSNLLGKLLSRNYTESELKSAFNFTSFSSVMQRVLDSLQQQMTQMSITDGIPMLLQAMMNLNSPEIAKAMQTVSAVLSEVNERLTYVKDSVTIETLMKNSTLLAGLFRMALNTNNETSNGVMLKGFALEKLFALMANPEDLAGLCKNSSLAKYLSTEDSTTMLAKDVATLLCTDTNTFIEKLINETDVNDLISKIGEIQKSHNRTFDIADLSKNIDTFTKLVDHMIKSPPSVDSSLATISLNGIIEALGKMFEDPTQLYSLVQTTNPFLSSAKVPVDAIPFAVAWQETYNMIEKMFTSNVGTLNNSILAEFYNSLTSFNTQANLYAWTPVYYEMVLKEAGKRPEIQDLVCNVTAIQMVFGMQNNSAAFATDVKTAICSVPSTQWYFKMQNHGFPIWPDVSDFVAKMEGYYKQVTGKAIVDHLNFKWSDMSAQIQNIVKWFSNPDVDWNDVMQLILGDTSTTQDQMAEFFKGSAAWFKTIGLDKDKTFLGALKVVSEINDYLSKQLDSLKRQGQYVPLTTLLPNNTDVSFLLENALGKNTAAAMLMSLIHPDMFLTLSLTDRWVNVTCNMTVFKTTFTFPAGTNVSLIQQDLCRDVSSRNSAIAQVLDRIDMTKVLHAMDSFIHGRGNMWPNGTDIWYEAERISGQFLLNIGYLSSVNITMDGIDKWMEPVLHSLQALQNPSMNNLESTCDGMLGYIENTELYKETIMPVLTGIMNNMYLTKQQMKLQTAIEDVICDIPSLNITTISQKLMQANITQFIEQLMAVNSSSTMGQFSCSSMIRMSNDLSKMWNESIIHSMNQAQKWSQCFQHGLPSFTNIMEDISRSFNIAGELLHLLRDSNVKTLLGNSDIVPILDFMFKVYQEQQKSIMKITDLLVYNSTQVDIIRNLFKSTPELIDTLLKSTLSLSANDLLNKTSAEIASIICDANKLDDFIHLPAFATNITMIEISKTLCGSNVAVNADLVKELISVGTLSLAVTTHGVSVSNTTWWTSIGDHLANMLSIIQKYGIIDLSSFASLDINNIEQDLLRYAQEFIFSNGPEALASSFKVLLEDLKSIDNSTMTRSIISDVQVMVDGFTSLKVIRNFIPSNVVIRDVLKDPDAFRRYLLTNVSLSEDTVNALMDGTIYYSTLLQYSKKDIPSFICNSTKLSELINISSTVVKTEDVSASLCKLNDSIIVTMSETILQDLDIGSLVERYVTSSFDELLGKVNMTSSEIKTTINKISSASSMLEDAALVFNNKTAEYDVSYILEPEALTGTSSMSSLQNVVCGTYKSSSGKISDVTGVSSSVGKPAELNAKQLLEMDTLPGEFCQNLYRDIILMEGGPVIWAYLKPLIRGKILFTPKSREYMEIIEKVNNGSFVELAEVQKIAKSWSKGTRSITDMMKDKKALDESKKLLSDNTVNSVLSSVFGVSVDEITNGFSMLNNMDPSQIGNISKLADIFSNYTQCIETDRFYGFDTEKELELEAANLYKSNRFLAAIIFEDMDSASRQKRDVTAKLPKHIKYTIRMDIDNVEHTVRLKERFWRPYPEDNFFTEMRYFRGFIQLQDMLERAIINLQSGNTLNVTTYLQQFPTPCHINDQYLNVLSSYLLPILVTVAWLASMAVATKNLVYDRENGQEEALKTMGMFGPLNWWAWFLSTMMIMLVVSLISCIILRVGNLFVFTNFLILFLFFVTFCFSSTMMCYMVSSFFTRTTMAILSVLVFYLMSYIPYIVLSSLETDMTYWQKTLACLFSTTAFGFGAQYLSRYEIQMEGIQWSNIKQSPIAGDEFSFSWACWIMLIDGLIYFVIGWYIRMVKPGKYGISQPFYFLFTPSYWGCLCSDTSSRYTIDPSETLEEENDGRHHPGISIRGLHKSFGDQTVVKNINCDFYEGQVTVLLGHNGAAKTTTINMITGVLEASKGSVYISGQPASKRSSTIGICPQHNALFEYMTVQEHVEFYACMKSNLSKAEIKFEVERLLHDVELWHVRKQRVSSLSGGMKRKLCVVLAFAGGSEAVVLDEPTSGVDPVGRRAIWNLVQKQKFKDGRKDCTILLSTHYLDEADIIGDRVAIMHEGRVMCIGSPLFLKQSLGSGYHMKFVKSGNCDVSAVLSMIQYTIPEAEVIDQIGSEVTISLPMKSVSDLQGCLHDIDTNAKEMGIGNYGIYDTTMDEIFGKVCSIAESNKPMTSDVIAMTKKSFKIERHEEEKIAQEEESNELFKSDSRKRVRSGSQKLQQFQALLLKRFNHYRRDWRMFLSVIILPLVFVTAGLGFMQIKPEYSAPSRILTPPLYGPHSTSFIKDSIHSRMSQSMMDHFVAKPGLGTTCMQGMNFGPDFQCVDSDLTFDMTPGSPGSPNCTCTDYEYHCNAAALHQKVPQTTVQTTTRLQKLDYLNVEEYLLQTWEMHKLDRYGGWSIENDDKSDAKGFVWFNNKGRHAMPAFYNGLSNSLLRTVMADKPGITDPEHYGITAVNHPFMFSREQLSEATVIQSAADMGISLIFLVAFTFVPVGFVIYVVNEYRRKEKQLQYISGVGPVMYWVTSLLWDLFIFCLAVGLAIAIMSIPAFRNPSYWYRDNLAAVTCLILLYGWATIPCMYSTVKLFRDSSSAYMILFCSSIFIAIITITFSFLLEFMSSKASTADDPCGVSFYVCFRIEDVKKAYDVIIRVFLVFPQFSFLSGFMDIVKMQVKTDILSRFGEDLYQTPFSMDLIGWNYIALAIEGLVFFILTLFLEINCCRQSRVPSDMETETYKDSEEVNNERQRVLTGYCRGDALIVSNLTKMYKRSGKPFLAVDRLCFGVPKGECFGLLGVNGAGKTTTFKMLTGDLVPSEGSAYLKGQRIAQGNSNIGQELGYCPQEDALDNFLTGRELLHCYARLRGLPSDTREAAVNSLIWKLNLNFADKVIHKYSGGMKRKLSLAISMIGDPPVVLLDEPTTGMDPSTKRLVWNCVLTAVKNGQSVVLTSHSMEECDALCTRMSIMVNGEMKCLGGPQLLKQKYGDGYTVTLYFLGLSTVKHDITEVFNTFFPGSHCTVHHRGVLQVNIPHRTTSVAQILKVLEEQKERCNIQHYSVSQTTLYNVFLNFAREQTDGIILDSTDSLLDSSTSEMSSENFFAESKMNPTYSYMNPSFSMTGKKNSPAPLILHDSDIMTKL